MADIKLKPDCELQKAIAGIVVASVAAAGNADRVPALAEARAHLLEVIFEGYKNALLAKTGMPYNACVLAANQIMGVESDE